MKPTHFAYRRPDNLTDAAELLRRSDGEAKLLAGGQSLVPLMNFRLARPSLLVDLAAIPELDYVRAEDGVLAIGALTRQASVEESSLARVRYPLLTEAITYVGHPAIRNRGTVGGSIAHADPAGELPCLLVATGGSVVVFGSAGKRVIQADDFFLSYFQTALDTDEILVEARFPLPAAGSGWAFAEVARRSGDFALAMVAVLLSLDETGRIATASIGLGAVAPAPMRARAAEALLLGERPEPALLDATAEAIGDATSPDDDIHATSEDRRHLAVVLGRRALAQALARVSLRAEER